VLDASYNSLSSSAYANPIGHQGLHHDKATGLIYNRARMLNPTLGRFTSRDPLGYVDGMSLYRYLGSSPVGANDPWGLYDLEFDDSFNFQERQRIKQRLQDVRKRAKKVSMQVMKELNSLSSCMKDKLEDDLMRLARTLAGIQLGIKGDEDMEIVSRDLGPSITAQWAEDTFYSDPEIRLNTNPPWRNANNESLNSSLLHELGHEHGQAEHTNDFFSPQQIEQMMDADLNEHTNYLSKKKAARQECEECEDN
jgi:RHS repeat-associated protein